MMNLILNCRCPSERGIGKAADRHQASMTDDTNIQVLIRQANADRCAALHFAAGCGLFGVARMLEEHREKGESCAGILQEDGSGNLPIHLACETGYLQIDKSLLRDESQIKSQLT